MMQRVGRALGVDGIGARSASAIALLLGAMSSGCPSWSMRVQATVTSAEPARGGGEAAAAQPVEGASVSMDCPQVIKASGPSLLGQTDAQGELRFEEPVLGRWIHDGCDLVVEKPGYKTRRFPVAAVCMEYKLNHCVRAVVVAPLAPAR
jgi:hypothetical protein